MNSMQQRGSVEIRRFTLVEVLAYMALFAVVTGIGTQFFLNALTASRNLRAAGEDILRVNRFGDTWRQDIREGRLALPANLPEEGILCRIKRHDGRLVTYRYRDDTITRNIGGEQSRVLKRVDACRMVKMHDATGAWRLDVELRRRRNPANTRPLFAFIGVVDNPPLGHAPDTAR